MFDRSITRPRLEERITMSEGEQRLHLSGRLVSIHLGEAGAELSSPGEAMAVAGRGLEGDRYFNRTGSWSTPGLWSEVTLVEVEAVEALRDVLGCTLRAGVLRRNLVTRGVGLLDLVGERFQIGDAVLEGVRSCDPCRYLERLAGQPGLKKALKDRGGLRARVIVGGILREGDEITTP